VYHLVDPAGDQDIACDGPAADSTEVSGGTQPGGEGTTVHTVICPEPSGHATYNTGSIVRGWIDSSVVSDADDIGASSNENPLEAADVSASGNSAGPDLASVIFAPDALVNADAVAFLFDENVDAGIGGPFAIYNTAGDESPNGAPFCSRSTENSSIVICGYPDGTLSGDTFVGGNVGSGAVTDLQGITGLGDEAGATPSAGPSRTSGKTDGPDLTGVAITSKTSPLGTTTFPVTYTFDEDTDDALFDISLLHLYTSDGIQLTCIDLTGGDPTTTNAGVMALRGEDADNTVTCTKYEVSSSGDDATAAQVHAAVVGTVDFGAVDDESTTNSDVNPEGAELTTGTSGTPA
jgi:hypothetical protein